MRYIFCFLIAYLNALNIYTQVIHWKEDFENPDALNDPNWKSSTKDATSDGWKIVQSETMPLNSFKIPPHSRILISDDSRCGKNCNKSKDVLQRINLSLPNENVFLSLDYYFEGVQHEGKAEIATLKIIAEIDTIVELKGQTKWQHLIVPLHAYKNQNITLEFKYNDGGGWNYGLALDNLMIFSPQKNDIALTRAYLPPQIPINQKEKIYFEVANLSADTLQKIKLEWRSTQKNNRSFYYTYTEKPILPFSKALIAHEIPYFTLLVGIDTLTVLVTEVAQSSTELTPVAKPEHCIKQIYTHGLYAKEHQNNLVEYHTSAECGLCPTLNSKFTQTRPNIIPVALHSEDSLANENTAKILEALKLNTKPSFAYNRELILNYEPNWSGFRVLDSLVSFSAVSYAAVKPLVSDIQITSTKLSAQANFELLKNFNHSVWLNAFLIEDSIIVQRSGFRQKQQNGTYDNNYTHLNVLRQTAYEFWGRQFTNDIQELSYATVISMPIEFDLKPSYNLKNLKFVLVAYEYLNENKQHKFLQALSIPLASFLDTTKIKLFVNRDQYMRCGSTKGAQLGAWLSKNVSGEKYVWSPSNGLDNPNSPTPIATPKQSTTYTVTVSVGDKELKDSVKVFVGFKADFTSDQNLVILPDTQQTIAVRINFYGFTDSELPVKMNWNFGDLLNDSTGKAADIPNPSYTYTRPGKHTVQLNVIHSDSTCKGDTMVQKKDWIVIQQYPVSRKKSFAQFANVKVFPNPASGKIFIQKPENNLLNFKLYDSSGKLILRKQSEATSNIEEIALERLSPGIYLLTVQNSEQIQNFKIIVF